MSDLPLYVHIGYPKTASSWLQRFVFPLHSNLAIISPGITPDFPEWPLKIKFDHQLEFDREFVQEDFQSSSRAIDKDALLLSWEVLVGEPLFGAYDLCRTADRLHLCFPDSRIIIVIREQTSILNSLYKQYVQLGGFRRPQNLFGISPHEHAHFNFVYFRYDKVIDYYVKLFGKKNVHVVLFEQLRENPQTTLDELFGFMNIAALPLPLDVLNQEENVSLSNATIWAELFLNRFLGSKVNPKPIIPTRIVNARVLYHFMSRWLDPLIFRRFSKINKKKSLITPSMISFCRDYYREGNQSLVDTYQLPLGKYGYSL